MHSTLRTYVYRAGLLLALFAGVAARATGATAEMGDFDQDRKLDADDIDQLTAAILAGEYLPTLDLNVDGELDGADRVVWVEELAETYFGDTNLNGVFNTGDLVKVFQGGQYEDEIIGNSTWATGDWNGDAEFGSGDLVLAFASGAFEGQPRLPSPGAGPQSVPEPSAVTLLALGALALIHRRRQT